MKEKKKHTGYLHFNKKIDQVNYVLFTPNYSWIRFFRLCHEFKDVSKEYNIMLTGS